MNSVDIEYRIREARRLIDRGLPKESCALLRPVFENYLVSRCRAENVVVARWTIGDMIHALYNCGSIDRVTRGKFLTWKDLGNAGSHPGSDVVTVSDAEYFLNGLSELLGVRIEPMPSPVSPPVKAPPTDAPEDTSPIDDHLGLMSSSERRFVLERIGRWAANPRLNVHKIVAIVASARDGISRDELVQRVARVTRSKNSYGAVASLLTSKGNAYGRAFIDVNGTVRLHPAVEAEIRRYRWTM